MPRYFAYGSNMDWGQMADRCPSAAFVCVAYMKDRRLAFTRYSTNRGCGVADVVEAEGEIVWGVVYQIDDDDVPKMDFHEGFAPGRATNAYWRKACAVFDESTDEPMNVFAYFAERQADWVPPSTAYKKLLVDGANNHGLPADYLARLEAIEVAKT